MTKKSAPINFYLLILLPVLILVTTLIFLKNNLLKKPSSILNNHPISINDPDLANFLNSLKDSGFKPSDYKFINWQVNDDWTVVIADGQTINLLTQAADDSEEVSLQISKIDNLFKANGFISDSKNTVVYPEGSFPAINSTRGYTKANKVCLVTLYRSSPTDLSITCSTSFQAYYDQELPFLKVLKSLGRKGSAYVEKANNVAAKVEFADSLGLFIKNNNRWQLIYEGQEKPPCSLLQQYSFPADVEGECNIN